MVSAGAGVNADALAFFAGEVTQHLVIEIHKLLEQPATGIQLDRQATLGEVDLHHLGAVVKAAADIPNRFGHQISDELVPGVAGDSALGVQEGHGRSGNDRLLQGSGGEAPCCCIASRRGIGRLFLDAGSFI